MDNLIMNGKMICTWSVKGVDGYFDGWINRKGKLVIKQIKF